MGSKKHIKITGCSEVSWKDAIVKTITEASNTLYNLSNLTVIEQRAKIQDDKIVEYYVDLDIEFEINKNCNCNVSDDDDLN